MQLDDAALAVQAFNRQLVIEGKPAGTGEENSGRARIEGLMAGYMTSSRSLRKCCSSTTWAIMSRTAGTQGSGTRNRVTDPL